MKSASLKFVALFVVFTSFTTIAAANETIWTDGAAGDSLWSNPGNWSAGVPGAGTSVLLNRTVDPALIDAGTTAVCAEFVFCNCDPPVVCELEVTGGSLTILGDYWEMGEVEGNLVGLYIDGGVVDANNLRAGIGDTLIIVTGGELNLTGTLEIPRAYAPVATAAGVLLLEGGVVCAGDLTLNNSVGGLDLVNSPDISLCQIDVTQGTLILDGDKTAKINGYIDNGLITAYDNSETASISMAYDPNTNKTTVIACEEGVLGDFNLDCVVDDQDRQLLLANFGEHPPLAVGWDFDMSTDPIGSEQFDLHSRNEADSGNYEMTDANTMLVTNGILFDQHAYVTGEWDTTLHYVARAMSDASSGLNLWAPVGMSAEADTLSLLGLTHYLDGATQTIELWTGSHPYAGTYAPIVVEGFAADAMVDVMIETDFNTDTLDWTVTDGILTKSGTDVAYTKFDFEPDTGGRFTLQFAAGAMFEVDQYTHTIHGSNMHNLYDLNRDGVVDQADLDILEAEIAK